MGGPRICLRLPAFVAALMSLSACTGAPTVECSGSALDSNELANDEEAGIAVSLDVDGTLCTGVAINRSAILTAAHCLPSSNDPPVISAIVRQGIHSEGCLSGGSPCTPSPFTVRFNPRVDIALLLGQLEVPDQLEIPILCATCDFNDIIAVGFGATRQDDVPPGTATGETACARNQRPLPAFGTLRRAQYQAQDLDDEYFFADAAPDAICDGDSGGPALLPESTGVAPVVVGIASTSDGNTVCTTAGGVQVWTRIAPEILWIQQSIAGCTSVMLDGGMAGLDCGSGSIMPASPS